MQACKIDPLFDTLDNKTFVIFPPHLLLEHLSVCIRVCVCVIVCVHNLVDKDKKNVRSRTVVYLCGYLLK